MLCEMQTVSSRIWTQVTMSISYDSNHYTTNGSLSLSIYIYIYTHTYMHKNTANKDNDDTEVTRMKKPFQV